jgi:hypothetical protein
MRGHVGQMLTRLRHGNQGILDTASNGALESEFGTHKEDDVVKAILEKGTVQETEVRHPPLSPIIHLLSPRPPTECR